MISEEMLHNILIIEDEESHQDLIRRSFESAGDRVHLLFASSIHDAEDIIRTPSISISLIIADWLLPDGKGVDLLIKNTPLSLPVIIMTSHGSEELAVEIMKAGALDYVVKSEANFLDMPHIAQRAIMQWDTVTRLHESQMALTESERRYRTMIETANEGIWAINNQFITTYVNRKMADMLLYNPEEMIGKKFADFMFAEDLADHDLRMKHRIEGLDERYERRFREKGGGERWFIVSGRPLQSSGNTFDGSFAMLTDITGLKRTKDLLNRILESSPYGVCIINPSYEIEYANPVLINEFGPVGGKKCFEYLKDLSLPCPVCRFEEVISTGSVQWQWYSQKTGHYFNIYATPFLNQKGIICNLYFFHDITERKEAEQELKHALEQITLNMETFAALNDQIRNPLSVIMVLADELPDSYGKQIYGPVKQIDEIITKLDMGWITSDKVRRFLMKHYDITIPPAGDKTDEKPGF